VFDVKDVPPELADCFEPAECGECYVCEMVAVFREVRRILRDDGVLFLNLGDSYATSPPGNKGKHATGEVGDGAYQRRWDRQLGQGEDKSKIYHKPSDIGLKPKDLVGIPWRVAFALQADGWYLRQDIIWHKPNPMPESVTDRCTKAHEYVFLLSKSARYYYDAEAVREPLGDWSKKALVSDWKRGVRNVPPGQTEQGRIKGGGVGGYGDTINPAGRNRRSVWTVPTQPYSGAHYATFPPALIAPCILAGCPQGGTVLDPFGGSGTTGEVAEVNGRNSVLIELNPQYVELAKRRTGQGGLFCSPNMDSATSRKPPEPTGA